MGCYGLDGLARVKERWRVSVNMVMNLWALTGSSWVTLHLAASQEELRSMELNSFFLARIRGSHGCGYEEDIFGDIFGDIARAIHASERTVIFKGLNGIIYSEDIILNFKFL